MSTIQNRLKTLRGETPQAKFAADLGVTQSTLGRYERGESQPDVIFLQAIIDKLGVEPNWLMCGTGPAYDHSRTKVVEATCESGCDEPLSRVVLNPQPVCDVDVVFVPMVEARLSAGTGSFEAGGESERRYAFRNDFLSRKGQPSQMVLMRVTGDSMEPEIHHGDVVLIDQSQTVPRPGGLYAVGVENLVYIKMVDSAPGQLVLKSYNETAYPPLTIDARGDLADGIKIIGKAIWMGREMR